jgi:hypothetical protein
MTNALQKEDLNIQSTQQLMDSLSRKFGTMYDALADKPEVRQMMEESWAIISQLHNINSELDALLAGAEAAMVEIGKQRDIAVYDAATWKKHGAELALRILGGHIAVDGKIPVMDVMRVLDVLAGKKATFEEPRLEALYQEIRDLANALYEEQTYTAASADEEK